MSNFLPLAKIQEIRRSFDAGFGIRATSAALGISKNTVTRYYRQGPAKLCSCGKPLLHRGWCSTRIERSPARKEFLAQWNRGPAIIRPKQAPIVLLRYPYIAEGQVEVDDLLIRVHAAVPRHLPEHVRSDVCQDMLVALLAQEMTVQDIPARMKDFLRQHYRDFGQFRHVSLDAPIAGTDSLRLMDTISNDAFHF